MKMLDTITNPELVENLGWNTTLALAVRKFICFSIRDLIYGLVYTSVSNVVWNSVRDSIQYDTWDSFIKESKENTNEDD